MRSAKNVAVLSSNAASCLFAKNLTTFSSQHPIKGPPTENNALSGTVRAQTELYEKRAPLKKGLFMPGNIWYTIPSYEPDKNGGLK